MTAYEAVRAHELMLNEAASRFEHARVTPLIALNGGAVVAFLTLLGALLGKENGGRPDLLLSGFAAGAWVVGLVAAALAIAAAASQQTAISAAHRLLREGLEDALIDQCLAQILQGPPPTVKPPPLRALRSPVKRAKHVGRDIEHWWRGPPQEKTREERTSPTPGGVAAEGDMGAAKTGSDFWAMEQKARQDKRTTERRKLRSTASAHAQRFKARWWLSVAMFVTGAALALAAILSGSGV